MIASPRRGMINEKRVRKTAREASTQISTTEKMAQTYSQRVLDLVKTRNSHEKEFIQAVQEVLNTIEPVLAANSKYEAHAILERIVEPERTILFRVPWIDDQGKVQVNRGYRVEFNSAIGPYKGGLRLPPQREPRHSEVPGL